MFAWMLRRLLQMWGGSGGVIAPAEPVIINVIGEANDPLDVIGEANSLDVEGEAGT